MESEKKEIINKYKQNINKIIRKYEKYEDDDLEVIDIFTYEDQPTFCIDSISFIKNDIQKMMVENSPLILFQDIYKMLCTECDFEDIYRILR